MSRSARIAAISVVLAAPLLGGCLSLGLTQSAQTLSPGSVQHTFGLEWFHIASLDSDYPLPFAMPFYGVRGGLMEGVDAGFRTNATFSNIGLDLKLQPLDSPVLDVAVDPTLQFTWVWGFAELPLLFGLNLSESFQIVLSTRIAYNFPLIDDSFSREVLDAYGVPNQAAIGAGLGLYIRLGRTVAFIPEVQALKGFGDSAPWVVSVTLGFALGDQPGVPQTEAPSPGPPAPYPGQPQPYPYPAQPQPYPYPAQPQPAPAPTTPPALTPTTPPGYGPPGTSPEATPPLAAPGPDAGATPE